LPEVDFSEITPEMLKTESQKQVSSLKAKAKESTAGLADLPKRALEMFQGVAP